MKTVEEIYENMKSIFKEKTGATVSDLSDMGVRMYTFAWEIGSLYAYNDWVHRQCFPQTADGDALDNHGALRGIYRDMGAKARGSITFYASDAADYDRTVPKDTVCTTENGVSFKTLSDLTLSADELSVTGECECTEIGEKGNVASGRVKYMPLPPVGIISCENDEFSGGRDVETDEKLRERIVKSYRMPINGANDAYYEYLAKQHEGVKEVVLLPKNRGLGTIDLVISSDEGMPSSSLIAEVQADIDEKRELCVSSVVSAPTALPQIIRVAVTTKDGYTLQNVTENINKVLSEHFDGSLLGKKVLVAELINLVFNTEGVANCALTYPTEDVETESTELPTLQNVYVTELGE